MTATQPQRLDGDRTRSRSSDTAPVPGAAPLRMVQFLSADGEVTPEGRAHGIDLALARGLFLDMARARTLDREALALQRQGELSLWLQCWGQEAAQVGSVRALGEEVMVFPSYREHAVALCRGIEPVELLAQWRGVSHTGWVADHRRLHFYSLVLGTQTLHATGYAMGNRLKGDGSSVAVYFGDGAASQGDVSEAMNWAAVFDLPVIFFCQNNQWAISTPPVQQQGAPLHQRASGFGLRSWFVDGNDVLAVHAVTREAAEWVAQGRGPAFIEAETFRMAGHSTSDDPKRYRSDLEMDRWTARDPLLRLQAALREHGVDEAWFAEVEADSRVLAAQVRKQCLSLRPPSLDSLFDNVYAGPHADMVALRQEHAAFLALVESSGEAPDV